MKDTTTRDKKYQIWLGGSTLYGHVWARSKTAAMRQAREIIYADLNCRRIPADTGVCEITESYYRDLAASSAPMEG